MGPPRRGLELDGELDVSLDSGGRAKIFVRSEQLDLCPGSWRDARALQRELRRHPEVSARAIASLEQLGIEPRVSLYGSPFAVVERRVHGTPRSPLRLRLHWWGLVRALLATLRRPSHR